MNRKDRLPLRPLVVGMLGGVGVIWAIVKLDPNNVYVETMVVMLGAISEYFILKWLTKKGKIALTLTVLTCGMLVLERLAFLDVLTATLLLIIALLISFLN
jgi:hypothetical protein